MANFMADNIPAVLVSAKSDSPLCFSAQSPTPPCDFQHKVQLPLVIFSVNSDSLLCFSAQSLTPPCVF